MDIIATLPQCGNGFIGFYLFSCPLFHADSFNGAGIDTDTTVYTGVGVDFCLFAGYTDGLTRALAYT